MFHWILAYASMTDFLMGTRLRGYDEVGRGYDEVGRGYDGIG